MSRKFFVLINPSAGRQKHDASINFIREFFDQHNCAYEIWHTKENLSTITLVAENLDHSFTDLLIVGGDGTINEAINGIDTEVIVSFYPEGSGNDFVKTLDIGHGPRDFLDVALNGNVYYIDLGICNKRKFVNGLGIGFDGQIVEDMQHRKVPFLQGHAKYYYHVLSILAGYKPRKFRMIMDGKKLEKDLILLTIGNGTTFGGGFRLTPNAKINDGTFEVCMIGNVSPVGRFLNVGGLKSGKHSKLKEVELTNARSLEVFDNEELYCHIDGEVFGTPPFQIDLIPGALQIHANAIL